MQKQSNQGFTLVELLVVIAIAGILTVWGVASFRTLIQNNRSLALSSDFSRAVNFTRNEAIKRSGSVSMCAANTALNACGSSWTNGWLIFSDANGNGVYDSGTDTILRNEQAYSGQQTLTAPSTVLTFSGTGFLTTGSGNYLISATGCSGNNSRTIAISASGRITIQNTACP